MDRLDTITNDLIELKAYVETIDDRLAILEIHNKI